MSNLTEEQIMNLITDACKEIQKGCRRRIEYIEKELSERIEVLEKTLKNQLEITEREVNSKIEALSKELTRQVQGINYVQGEQRGLIDTISNRINRLEN